MPKVSVIVPIYNVREYLKGCLESVAAQTLQDFECICVDDGSTDTSGQIADKFAAQHSKNFFVIHKKNGGLSSARNAGLRQATGEYVFFLDSDDYIHPLTLETMVNDSSQAAKEAYQRAIAKYRLKRLQSIRYFKSAESFFNTARY